MVIDIATLQSFAGAVLNAAGANPGDAAAMAKILLWADSVGRTEQGVERLPILTQRLEKKLFKSPASFVWSQKRGALQHLDAAEGLGHLAASAAADRSIELAREFGLGAVSVANSNYFGAAGYFAWLIAEADMIGLVASNSFPKVAPPGGVKAILGTNPLAFAAPVDDDFPLLVDMATAAVAGSEIRRRKLKGMQLDPGMAVYGDGRPLLDPADFSKGVALPFGGAKGFGVMMLVEVLTGVLSGGAMGTEVKSMYADFANSGRSCHFLLAIDPEHILPSGDFTGRMRHLKEMLRASGADVRLPGSVRWQFYERSIRDGIERENLRVDDLKELGSKYGVPAAFLEA